LYGAKILAFLTQMLKATQISNKSEEVFINHTPHSVAAWHDVFNTNFTNLADASDSDLVCYKGTLQ